MEWHIKEALRAGASQKQVIEAIEVGIEMGGGPATVSSRSARAYCSVNGLPISTVNQIIPVRKPFAIIPMCSARPI